MKKIKLGRYEIEYKNGGYFHDGNMDLSYDESIISLPETLTVTGFLSLRGCTSLISLPETLTVIGFLYLEGCTSLVSLPETLKVGDSLILTGCTSLVSLPKKLKVGDSLILTGCTSLKSYPLVHDCGSSKRIIHLDFQDKSLIQIGCRKSTKAAAIEAINAEYKGKAATDYIAKVEECFAIWEEMKNSKA